MVRYSLCVSICFAAIGAARGSEPAPVPAAPTAAAPVAAAPVAAVPGAAVSKCTATAPVADAKPATGISGRKRIEALLASPADLDFGDRETITVKELLAKLREQHQLSIRFDVPTLAGMYGDKQDGESKSTSNPLTALTEPLSNAIASRTGNSNHVRSVEPPNEAPSPPAPVAGYPVAGANLPLYAAPAAAQYGAAPSPYPTTSAPAAYGGSGYSTYGPGASPASVPETTAPAAPPAPAAASPNAPALPVSPSSPPTPAYSSTTSAHVTEARTAATVEAPAAAAATQSIVTKPYSTTAAPPLVALPATAPVSQVMPATASGSLPTPQSFPDPGPQVQPDADPPCHEPAPQKIMDDLLNCEVDIRTIDLKRVSVATALRHALDALPTVNVLGDGGGSPIMVSNCTLIDYLVEPDGVQITTRLKALTYKETRVYSLKNLKGVTPEQAAAVIRQSIRPWSWRSRIDELGDQLRGNATAKALGAVIKPYAQEAAAESGLEVNLSAAAAAKPDEKGTTPDKKTAEMSDADQAAMYGNAIVNCVVTYMHSMLTVLEVVHYADPPTGSIQILPGKLIITQSQAAHREIAELLEQLSEE